MKNKSRKTLENVASKLGYDLSEASSASRMKAAGNYEPVPRWELNPVGNHWEDCVKGYVTLADVERRLDEIDIEQGLKV